MKHTYLSGGMTGYKAFNYPFFRMRADELRKKGVRILNPSDDIKPMKDDGTEVGIHDDGVTWTDFLRGDIIAVLNDCDSLYMTKGWFASKGARFEHFVGKKMGYSVEYARPFIVELFASVGILFCQKVLKIELTQPF